MAQVDEAIVAEKREHMEKLLKVELKSAEEEMRLKYLNVKHILYIHIYI